MEKKLKELFDYQKFAQNAKLQSVIDSVHRRPRELLLDDSVELVSAAGAPYLRPTTDTGKESHL